jgi:hypothetical protein
VHVNLSNDDDVELVSKPDVPAIKKGSAGDDTGGDGVTSVEPVAPGTISSTVLEQSKPSVANRVLCIVPSSGKRGRKRSPPVTKQSKQITSADQVMFQVELPPYRGPHSSLDLFAIEIIFGRIFEAFQQISQAVVASATSADASRPMKRVCHPPLKKALMPQ